MHSKSFLIYRTFYSRFWIHKKSTHVDDEPLSMAHWLNLTKFWPQNELGPLWSDVQVMFWNMFPEVTPILMSLMFSNVMAYFELRFETCLCLVKISLVTHDKIPFFSNVIIFGITRRCLWQVWDLSDKFWMYKILFSNKKVWTEAKNDVTKLSLDDLLAMIFHHLVIEILRFSIFVLSHDLI